MISSAVWVTSDEARLFIFNVRGTQSVHLHRHGSKHPAETHGKNHPKEGGDADRFFHEVAERLIKEGGERWLLLGPGLAKSHLKAHIERHHKQAEPRIVGIEAMDKATDGEIRDFAHRFFKDLGTFESL